jgi:hypothetical protein
MQCHVVWYKFGDVSEEHTAKCAKQVANRKQEASIAKLIFFYTPLSTPPSEE